MSLPSNLDADQADIVQQTLSSLRAIEHNHIIQPALDDQALVAAEIVHVARIREQMQKLNEFEFALLIRALVDAWEARA